MNGFGKFVKVIRKDNRVFCGILENVKYTPRGTMLVVREKVSAEYRDSEGNYHEGYDDRYKSVYVEESASVKYFDCPEEFSNS